MQEKYQNLLESLSNKSIFNPEIIKNFNFNYIKWIDNRLYIDKSLGPSSQFIINLENFMSYYLPIKYNKEIYINSAQENGESDLKIFKYISVNEINGDYCIHTTDSDLIHQMLIQQTYYKIINKDINISLIKYLKKSNYNGYAQILDGNLIIKNIIDSYNSINNIKTNNYKIIWDLCLIFYLFGNDHLPSSLEIGPELGLDFFLKKHYEALNNKNIVDLNITINFNNLILYLKAFDETSVSNITKILLQRFFKINVHLVCIFTEKFKFDFEQILDFLKKFIIYKGLELSSNDFKKLYDDDLRKILVEKLNIQDKSKYNTYKIFNFTNANEKLLEDIEKTIIDNINYLEHDYMGLITYDKPISITTDVYQDIYNYISDKTNGSLNTKYPQFYDHITLEDHRHKLNNTINNYDDQQVNDYLKKIFHLTSTQFGCMKYYHTDNLTFYKYPYAPSINNIIRFISKNNIPLTQKWTEEIYNDNIEKNNYLNFINHHMLITPFISYYDQNQNKNIKNSINNLWINDINNFDYRNIDIKHFFEVWNKL